MLVKVELNAKEITAVKKLTFGLLSLSDAIDPMDAMEKLQQKHADCNDSAAVVWEPQADGGVIYTMALSQKGFDAIIKVVRRFGVFAIDVYSKIKSLLPALKADLKAADPLIVDLVTEDSTGEFKRAAWVPKAAFADEPAMASLFKENWSYKYDHIFFEDEATPDMDAAWDKFMQLINKKETDNN